MLTLLTVLSIAELVLILALARRSREHAAALESLLPRTGPGTGLRPGDRPGDFTGTALDGAAVARNQVRLVGFVTDGCGRCKERLPSYLEAAGRTTPDEVLTVMIGAPDPAALTTAGPARFGPLGTRTRIVLESRGGPIATAFAVDRLPVFVALDPDGTVTAVGDDALTS